MAVNLIYHYIWISNYYKKSPYIAVKASFFLWSHLGSNQGPPDYESGALTN